MKAVNIFMNLFLVTLVFSILSCSNTKSKDISEHKTEINSESVIVADYTIEGMVCAMGCAKTIQDELSELNGIASCNVDFESSKAHIEYDKTQISENDIIALIEGLADGQYKVSEWKEEKELELEEGGESEEPITEVSLPNFEIPNLFHLLFNQL